MSNAKYILEFINSNCVYKHLVDIDYKPDSLTAAFIVWQSKGHTLSEKKKAFGWIINNMPDMPIPAHENHAARASLHEFLSKYIDTLFSHIRLFEFNKTEAIYDFSAYYGSPDNEWFYDDNVYSTYENAIEAAMSSCPPDNAVFSTVARPFLFRIRRRLTDLELGSDYLYLTPGFDYYKISSETNMTDDDFEILHLFENLCLPIPHPFKRGDIIRECAGKYALSCYYNDTLVVTGYHTKEYVCENAHILGMHNYTIYGFCSDGEGGTYEDSISHYLNAEIIEPGEVLIKDCVLLKESKKLKGEN